MEDSTDELRPHAARERLRLSLYQMTDLTAMCRETHVTTTQESQTHQSSLGRIQCTLIVPPETSTSATILRLPRPHICVQRPQGNPGYLTEIVRCKRCGARLPSASTASRPPPRPTSPASTYLQDSTRIAGALWRIESQQDSSSTASRPRTAGAVSRHANQFTSGAESPGRALRGPRLAETAHDACKQIE